MSESASGRSFDAVLVVGFGGPEGMAEVPAFLRKVSGGHIPENRLAEVAVHYEHFNGISPVNAQHREMATQIAKRLEAAGVDVPVVNANRHSKPFMPSALADLAQQGCHRVLAVVPTPYSSYSGCRAYREELLDALPGAETDLKVVKLDPYFDLPAVAQAQAEVLKPILAAHPQAKMVFTTHSIPTAMSDTSGSQGNAYLAQHDHIIRKTLALLAADGIEPEWELAYQSRSGSPHTPWLEPDINDVLERLAADGVTDVVCSPIGFLTDHMEVVWDLDNEATDTAKRLGVGFTRVPTIGTQATFLDSLTGLIVDALNSPFPADEVQTPEAKVPERLWCTAGCCPNPRASRDTVAGFAAAR